jgi:hypothetical protein
MSLPDALRILVVLDLLVAGDHALGSSAATLSRLLIQSASSA